MTDPVAMAILPAHPGDAPHLQEIERRAGQRFRDVGMPEIADDEPPSTDVLARYADDGRSWVAADGADRPIGYVLVDTVDGCAHIEQVTVSPDHQGAGVGRALVDEVRRWARERGMPAVTLTTFSEVPWHAPLYEHLGFRVVDEAEVGPELRALRDDEARHGLDPAQRVCMRAEITGEGGRVRSPRAEET